MNRFLFLSIVLWATSSAILLGARPGVNAGEKPKYEADLTAFFAEMDKSYPFFDLKDIRKGWPGLKDRLGKKVKRCASDTEFLGIVNEAIQYLRDGHMGIVKTAAKFPEPEPEWYPGIGLLSASKERVIILESPARFAKDLKPGTVVVQIDGKPARKFLEAKGAEAWSRGGGFSSHQRALLFEYRIPLRGKKGEKHKITILEGKRPKTIPMVSDTPVKGWPHTYNMPKGLLNSGRTCAYSKLASGAGYIYLRGIGNETEPGIAAALAAVPDAKGWIVDLRGNGGGGYDDSLLKRISQIPRPVACIVDAGCVSAGETFARDLVQRSGARLFGSTTAGSSSSKRQWTFPSAIATLSIPTRSRQGLGKCIEFFGIRPHEEIEADPEEVAKGLNTEILRAEEYLLKNPQGGEAKEPPAGMEPSEPPDPSGTDG